MCTIAYEIATTIKNVHFLKSHLRNVVHEKNFSEASVIKYVSKTCLNRSRYQKLAWSRIDEDIDHISKSPAPLKKSP